MAAKSPSAGLPYVQSVNGCLEAAIGGHGLAAADLSARLARLEPGLAALKQRYDGRSLAILRIAEETADIAAAEAALTKLSSGARTIVFFGTGGSALGGKTLAQFAGWGVPGVSLAGQKQRPRTRFYDNLDGATLEAALRSLDLATTRFVVISKSGGTVETLVQAIAAISACKAAGLGDRLPDLFLGITEPAVAGRANGLRALLAAHGIAMLDHHAGIGGRFSVLTNVGLLPALARGVDVAALRAGARGVIDQMRAAKAAADVPAAVGAAVAVGLLEAKGVRTHVMMPYADRLGMFAHWFVQLWAESLGKNGKGTSPIACLGPLDQHSQLQLFQDGPRDHLITILRTTTAGQGHRIDADLARTAGIGFLAGRPIGDLVAAQAQAVPGALAKAGRPVVTIDVPVLDAKSIGALLMHFMLETILVADLLGIDPYDQPAVELAKTLTRERLAKA
jgi:glucose-6-phosphate isomerase